MTKIEIAKVVHKFVIDVVIFGQFHGTEPPDELKAVGITRCEIDEDGAFNTYFADGTRFPWARYSK